MPETHLVTTQEFDGERTLRIGGDAALAGFSGQPLSGGVPTAPLPVYTDPVDLTTGTSLRAAVETLDHAKNSVQRVFGGSTLTITNARDVFFDSLFNVTVPGTGIVHVTLSGQVGWDGPHTESTLALTDASQALPEGVFCTGGAISYITIGRIAATFRVVAGITLRGRRGKIVPTSPPFFGLAEKRRLVLDTTTSVTVLAGETKVMIKAFGQGGDSHISGDIKASGGAGGFTYMILDVTTGQQFQALVNAFKGIAGSPFPAGGGLTGWFSGHSTVLSSDDSRMLMAAGGGGGGAIVSDVPYRGGHGNAGGGEAAFTGEAGSATDAGGGGGRRGGSNGVDHAGLGGTGYLSIPTAGAIVAQSGGLVAGPFLNPGTGDPDYPVGYGGPDQGGALVAVFYGP